MSASATVAPRPGRPRLVAPLRLARSFPGVALGLGILVFVGLIGVLAPVISPHSVETRSGDSFEAPSWSHPLGLDDGGVDMLSLLMHGARVSLTIGICAALVAVCVGGIVGLLSGYFGGWVDTLLMRMTDYFLVIPTLPLMIVIAALWGSSTFNIVLVIGLLGWAVTARVIRAQVISLKERVYVARTRSLGSSNARIILRHILPHLAPLLAATTAIGVADAVFAETGLAFLGLGDPNAISWGGLIENAFVRNAVTHDAWWAIVPPGICVAVIVVACSLIGRGIEDTLNPRLKIAHLATRTFGIRPLAGREREDV